jgi:hypothetical protein
MPRSPDGPICLFPKKILEECRSGLPPFAVSIELESAGSTRGDSRLNIKQEQEKKPMRVMVIVKANKESEAGVLPKKELLTKMGKYNEELVKAGIMLAGEGLQASSKGKRVKFQEGKYSVIDGPFTETKELIAGFWLWQVRSMEEAVEWLKRAPFGGGEEVEIRQVMEPEDLGEELPPEIREQEVRMRMHAAAKKK